MAYRTSSHLRAFYNHVYDGLDHPPRMNPLAIIRWRMKSDEQRDAKARWASGHKDANGNIKPVSSNAHSTFGGTLHSSPIDLASSPGSIDAEKSSESGRPSSLGSNRYPSPHQKQRDGLDAKTTAKGWRYTMEDVAAYKECDGVVNYFFPPRSILSNEASTDQSRSQHSRVDETSSVADSLTKDDTYARTQIMSASAVSLINADSRSMESPNVSLAPLSRSTSIETDGRPDHFQRDRRVCL